MSLTKPEWTARFTLHVRTRQPLFSTEEVSSAVEDAYRNASGLAPEEVAAVFVSAFKPRASGQPGVWPLPASQPENPSTR